MTNIVALKAVNAHRWANMHMRAERIGAFSAEARELAHAHWPGPLTLVVTLREDARIASIVTAGLPTIGVGHLLTRSELTSGKIVINGVPVKYADGLTEQQVTDLLAQDVKPAATVVNSNVKVPLNQNQYGYCDQGIRRAYVRL